MRIAYVTALGVHKHGGTEKSVAWLIEDLASENPVSVFANRVEDIEANEVKIETVPIITRPVLFRFLSFLVGSSLMVIFRGLFGKEEFEIINATGPDCLFANVITAQFCQARWLELLKSGVMNIPSRKLVQRAKYYLSHQPYRYLVRFLEKRIFASDRVKLIIAVSEGLKRDLVHYYHLSPDRIVTIPNSVDERVFFSEEEKVVHRTAIREQHGLGVNDLVLLFVAAGDWYRKGLPLVIEALSLLPVPNLKLLVVGRDNIPLYTDMAMERGVGERVVFAGFASDVCRYYATGDIFVYPSFFEAFALVTLEAAGAGLPIVATKINGTEELIEDGVNGFFVQSNPRDIAGKIALLIEDEQLRAKMGQQARKTAEEYSRQKVARRTLEAYERVLRESDVWG
jgi:UDP-glucose:(heptosyl)LPS alpha-1,3-glucosyltransferase